MKNWPWYGYLVFAILIFALAFLFYFKPQNAKLKVLTAERVKVEGEVQNLKQKKRELDKIMADITAMEAKLKTLEVNIPQRKEIADILRQIQALAYDSRLDVLRFAPGNEVTKDFYAEWPIPIQVSGNYHNLGTFFDKLSKFARVFTIENFTIKVLTRQTDLNTINANWTAKTYFFPEPSAVAAPAKKQARPKR
ncbi:MAG: type 4a pilus biogenesis protein PilO [Candidatus Aminicenantes bacterium]|nr:type 4a pilus biogenesis protein PilO [Candidatus Aminicenantes bacterium]NLH77122.1 type 4a pilus biogenesis protein PilO [Acidobacteriota bacterium]